MPAKTFNREKEPLQGRIQSGFVGAIRALPNTATPA
jgi:hypothetical protein